MLVFGMLVVRPKGLRIRTGGAMQTPHLRASAILPTAWGNSLPRPAPPSSARNAANDSEVGSVAACFCRMVASLPTAHAGMVLRERLAALGPRPQTAIARRLSGDAMRLRGLARSLQTVSPLATVARGYAILQHQDGRVVRSVLDAAPGDALDARLGDGSLRVRVEASGE